MSDLVKVTLTVTVTLTPAQRVAYASATGAGFVASDIAGRIRPEMTEALRQIPWLQKYAVVEISDPQASYEHVEGEPTP